MARNYNIYETGEYRFIKFSDIIKDIRDSFLDVTKDLESMGVRTWKKLLTHSTASELLKTYIHVDISKTTCLLVSIDTEMKSFGLLDDDKVLKHIIKTIDDLKRKFPILIKRIDCKFDEVADFLELGEGMDFLATLDLDKEKLRKNVCSFKEFKEFAKINGLSYIIEELIDKKEFKRLFIS